MTKKIISILLTLTLLFNVVTPVFALDIPTPPPAPTMPPLPTQDPVVPTPPPLPTLEPSVTPTPTETPIPTPKPTKKPKPTPGPTEVPVVEVVPTSTPTVSGVVENTGSGNQSENGGNGATIETGDATTSGISQTSVNNNLSTSPVSSTPSEIEVNNSGNGIESTNTGEITTSDTSTTIQTNNAVVGNSVDLTTITGNNTASRNTGGDNAIATGDANTTGTIINALNTNAAGVSVSEFNIADAHNGDYVLDYTSNCISGCGGGLGSVENSGNGADSTNTATSSGTVNTQTFQNNSADLTNSLILNSNSGDNNTNRNTGGDNTITTGDANVSGNVINLVNNNIAGAVYYGVVNIFGDLVGDIVLPESVIQSLGIGAANVGNGDSSTNTANLDSSVNTTINQVNDVVIENNVLLNAQTGENNVSRNTDGSNSVTTGDSNLTAQVLNIANSNLIGGNWWLVIVNEAGQWVGKIFGSPDGANFGGSPETEFAVGENGEITAINKGNGADSTNTAQASSSSNTEINQTNTAKIVNNIDLSSNTGGNRSESNTGGDSTIETGDANVIANLVNFVNNNIAGGGKLLVTVVNVFGSWIGNFRGPGYEAPPVVATDTQGQNGVGGASENNNNSQNSSDSGSNTSVSAPSVTEQLGGGLAKKFARVASNSVFVDTGEEEPPTEIPTVLGATDVSYNSEAGVSTINLAWIIPVLVLAILIIIPARFIIHRVRH